MTRRVTCVFALLASITAPCALADDDSNRRWWRDDGRGAHWARPCEVKQESKDGEFKREVKCKDGIGATWHGKWKDEFWDGPCHVKLEADYETFKEEVKCEGHD